MPQAKITTQVYSQEGEKVKELALNPVIFGVEVTEELVHQTYVAQTANARVAIAHTKQRGEISGGGRKPWRQKGTGRARHGSSRSPLWVGGAVTFGPTKDRNFSQKINKKMKRKALFMCLSDKAKNDFLVVLDKLSLESAKTKDFISVLASLNSVLSFKAKSKKSKENKKEEKTEIKKTKKFDIKDFKLSLLVVLPGSDKGSFRSIRNLPGIKVTTAASLNVVDLLRYQKVLMPEGSLASIEKTFLATAEPVAKKINQKRR